MKFARTIPVALFAASVHFGSALLAVHGQEVSLNGVWRFKPAPVETVAASETERVQRYSSLDLDDSSWETIQVPGIWNQPSGGWPWSNPTVPGGAHPDHHGEAWYRTSFQLPSSKIPVPPDSVNEKNFSALLRFDGISAQGSVWLNGAFVGRHIGAFSPFELDVSQQIIPDGTNVIAVRVRDKTLFYTLESGEPSNRTAQIPLGFDDRSGGIYRSVSLKLSPKARILDAFVQTEVDSATVEIMVSEEAIGSSTLTFILSDQATGKRVILNPTNEENVFAESARTILRLSDFPQESKIVPWSPENPNLYRLVLRLVNARGDVDEREIEFGFRKFSVAGSEIMLNGSPYFLLGAGSPPHYEYPAEDVARFHLQTLKDAGVRVVRFAHEPPPEMWLRLCDQIGLLAWVEGGLSADEGAYSFANPTLVNHATEEMEAIVRDYRNHPSVVIWAMGSGNCRALGSGKELEQTANILQKMAERVSRIDPTRVALPESDNRMLVNSPLEDWHTGVGWYYGKKTDWAPFLRAASAKLGGLDQPWVSGAIDTGYSSAGQGRLISSPEESAASKMRLGRYASDPDRLLSYQAERIEEFIEQARAERNPSENRISGLFPFTCSNWFFNPLTAGSIRPKPILGALERAYRPLLVAIDVPKKHFFAGEILQATLTVVNDMASGQTVPTGSLLVEILGKTEQASAQVEIQPVTAGSSVRYPLVLKLPNQPDQMETKVVAQLTDGETRLATNEARIWIAHPGKYKPSQEDLAGDILIHDPVGGLDRIWEGIKKAPQRFQEFGQLESSAGLLIGPNGWDDYINRGWPEISAWIEAGARVAVLEQSPVDSRWLFSGPYAGGFIPVIPEGWPTGIDRVAVKRGDHPLFRGLPPEISLFEWGNDRVVARFGLRRQEERADDFEINTLADVIPSIEDESWLDIVTELRRGEGSLIFCQLNVAEKAHLDPLASLVMKNLLQWVGGANRPIVYRSRVNTPFLSKLVGNGRGEASAEQAGIGAEDSVRAIPVQDGVYEATNCCLISGAAQVGILPLPNDYSPERRVYYDVDDRFWFNEVGACEVHLLVYCLSPGKLRLDYDSNDETVEHLGYYKQTGILPVLEVGVWKEIVFYLPDARFGNRQAEGTDFRISTVEGEAVYGPIVIRKKDSAG